MELDLCEESEELLVYSGGSDTTTEKEIDGVVTTSDQVCQGNLNNVGKPLAKPSNDNREKDNTEEEGHHPRDLLPTELWDAVFNRVTDSRDWLNSFYASSTFQTEPWLRWKEKRVHRLFPEVIKILNKNGVIDEEANYLTCRLVSKSWKLAVDQLLQHSTLQFCLSASPKRPWIDLWTAIEFIDFESQTFKENVDYWLLHPSTTNPFPSRQLEFWDMHVTDDSRVTYKKVVLALLNKFGHHLLYFTYHACRDDMFSCPVEWYITVRSWLATMPNLIKICLSYGGTNHVLNDEYLQQLEQSVGERPFPRLEELVSMETEHLPHSVLNSAMSVNSQIQRLRQVPNSYRLQWTTYGTMELNKLSEFATYAYCMYDIRQLQLVHWPLKRLKLRCWNVNTEVHWDFNEIIQAIHNFQSTLEYLKLDLTMLESEFQLQLPFLEELVIKVDNDGKNFLYFVSRIKSLKKLSLFCDLTGSDTHLEQCGSQESQQEYMNSYVAELFVLPLWEILPSLQSVFVHTYAGSNRVLYDYRYSRP